MERIILKLDNISKSYHIYSKPSDRLKQLFFGNDSRKFYQDFWALQNISFEINKGDAVAIIGENGAGKSTLLEIIAGTLTPTKGTCEVNGRISALLELGSGFNPEFTGRENIYMGASILGLKKKSIDEKYEAIIKFADIDPDFLDRPVKTYSSGMMMRLAFSVSTCTEPEILIVDEALSVGDAIFQAKCYSRIREMLKNGTSLLFVSHSIEMVRSICNKALWLSHGKQLAFEDAHIICDKYHHFCQDRQGIKKKNIIHDNPNLQGEPGKSTDKKLSHNIPEQIKNIRNMFDVNSYPERQGTGEVKIRNLILTDTEYSQKNSFAYNDEIIANYVLDINSKIDTEFNIGIRIRNLRGDYVLTVLNDIIYPRLKSDKNDLYYASFRFNIPIRHEQYYIDTFLMGYKDGVAIPSDGYNPSRVIFYDIIEKAIFFSVEIFKDCPCADNVQFLKNLNLIKCK